MNQKDLSENKKWITRLTNEAMADIPFKMDLANSYKLSEIQARIQEIQEEVHGQGSPTVRSTIQEIYELTTIDFSKQPTNSNTDIETIQELILYQIEMLSNLLGIELE